jgi:hypothetical protein
MTAHDGWFLHPQEIIELTHDYIIVSKSPQFTEREFFFSGDAAAPWTDREKAWRSSTLADAALIASQLDADLPFGWAEVREVPRA